MTTATVCPHCHQPVAGLVRPHCEGMTCGWLTHTTCGARIDIRTGRFACASHECVAADKHPEENR